MLIDSDVRCVFCYYSKELKICAPSSRVTSQLVLKRGMSKEVYWWFWSNPSTSVCVCVLRYDYGGYLLLG